MKWFALVLMVFCLPALLTAQNHLLISEIQVSPSGDEFIEIFNPNPVPVSLDSFYLSDNNTYYQIVSGTFSTESSDFLVKFPDGAVIDSAGVLVVALDGALFTGPADFEIRSTSATVPDMSPLHVGGSAGLANTSEMVMLFYWDGTSNRIYDTDYTIWGTTTSNFVDKSGIAPYANDTPVGSQQPSTKPNTGFSMTRTSILEAGEINSGGNGQAGHDETSEPIGQNFDHQTTPSPGSTSLQIPTGNGSGIVNVSPDSVRVDSSVTLNFAVKGNVTDTVSTILLTVPGDWGWVSTTGNVQLSGPAFGSATIQVTDSLISLGGAKLTLADSGMIRVQNLTTPSQPGQSVFRIETAVAGGTPKPIELQPRVTVWKPLQITTIEEVQTNSSLLGQEVTIEATVVLGAGITTTGWTDVYVQDESDRGINIYQGGTVDTSLVRGRRVRITGTVAEVSDVTELTNYTVTVLNKNAPLPAPVPLSTLSATNVELEGTYVEISGEVTDFVEDLGGGSNIRLNDGSGEALIRVWNSTGVDLSGVAMGVQLRIRGPLDMYQGATQMLLAYQEDLAILQTLPGDGSGTATVAPGSVEKGQSGVELDFTLSGESTYTLETIILSVPTDWQWSGDYALQGFAGTQVTVQGNQLRITQAGLTAQDADHIFLQNLTAPNEDEFSTFVVKTAVAGGLPVPIASSPRVTVGQGVQATPISELQTNTSIYFGQEVTILGTVVLGAGITATGWTSAYVQDNSGYGINIFQSGSIDNRLVRGNLVVITGTVDEYQGVTELVNYTVDVLSTGNPLPTPLKLTTAEANDLQWEGAFIEVEGEITDLYSAGGGTNINVDDGSGAALLRIWDTAGLNLTAFAVGDTIIARGPMGIYQGAAQLLVSYQEDIFIPGSAVAGDGTGFAALRSDSVALGASNIAVVMDIWGSQTDTVRTVEILLPNTWSWGGQAEQVDLSGPGFANAKKRVSMEYGEYMVKLSDCFLTATDTGTVALLGLGAPADSVYSYFWVKTAVEGGTPQFIAQSPRKVVGQNARYLIRDLQINSAQFKDPVEVVGIVTVGAGVLRTDRTSAYIQDASGYGINISQSGQPDTTYQRGRLLRINGSVSEYRQTTQFSPNQTIVLDEGLPLPAAVEVSTGEANLPRWDGMLIQVPRRSAGAHAVVTEKYTTSSQPPLDYNVTVNDGTGPVTLRVWGTTGVSLDSVTVNDAVVARGIGGVFIDRDGIPNYQLLPAYQDDIELDAGYQPSLAGILLDVPPHPFVPDRGEKIRIRYNAGAVNNRVTLRIYDTAGRLVTTILDEDARLIENTFEWDGRDELLDLVPLGTYICHLEVIEPITGKRRTRLAPVVVGTVLK